MNRVFAALVIVLTMSLAAEAKTRQFKDFSLDIPEGYKIEEPTSQGAGSSVTVSAPSGASVSYQYLRRKTASLEDMARALAKKEKAAPPRLESDSEENEAYVVEFKRKGVPVEVYLHDVDAGALIVTYTGKDGKLDDMWETFSWK